jgi:PRTRC genetic system protein A
MSDLATIFGGLTRHHTATPAALLPERRPGVTWIWAGDGIWKRGVDSALDILIRVHNSTTPGLPQLAPHVRWMAWPHLLPGRLLTPLLDNARRAASPDQAARPIERQYFLVWRDDDVRLVAPRNQQASAVRVRYAMPAGIVLLDVHSHHAMRAYFSPVDDDDDRGLSVSAVVGKIFDAPEITVRLNVYGHRARVSALTVFDALPDGLRDTYKADERCKR